MSNKTYKVTLADNFPFDYRRRAGVTVNKSEGYVGELTDDQVKEIKADPTLTLKAATTEEAETVAKNPDTGSKDETVTASAAVGTPNDTSGHGSPAGEPTYQPDTPYTPPVDSTTAASDDDSKSSEAGQASLNAVPKKAGK